LRQSLLNESSAELVENFGRSTTQRREKYWPSISLNSSIILSFETFQQMAHGAAERLSALAPAQCTIMS
jgi:hypothetical protein